MRKIFIILVMTAGVLSSCSDFLGKDPDNRTYIDTPEKVAALLVSAYPTSTFYSAVDARCDGFIDYGVDAGGGSSLFTFQEDAFRWREYSLGGEGMWDGVDAYWSSAYGAIAVANHALVAIDEQEASDGKSTELTRLRGEALLCRAYAHFCLLTLYSNFFDLDNMYTNPGIPYVTDPEKVTFGSYSRGTVASTLQNVIADMEEGMRTVGGASDYTEPKFHFTPQSALALATRVALFTRDYNSVIYYVNQLFPAQVSSYIETSEKNPDGTTVRFPASTDASRVFCRNYLTNWNTLSTYNDNPDRIGQEFASTTSNANLLLSEPLTALPMSVSANIYTRYSMDEQVFTKLATNNPTGADWTYKNVVFSYSGSVQGRVLEKYYTDFHYSDVVAGIGQAYTKLPLFRADEMLLARAEAYAMTGDYAKALDDLNLYIEMRIPSSSFDIATTSLTQAKILSYYATQLNGSSSFINSEFNSSRFEGAEQVRLQKALILTILDFRRIEFLYEGQRYYDILRWNIPVTHRDVSGAESTLTPDDDRRVLQIPQTASLAGCESNPMSNIPQPW
jgi:hypothetical protein